LNRRHAYFQAQKHQPQGCFHPLKQCIRIALQQSQLHPVPGINQFPETIPRKGNQKNNKKYKSKLKHNWGSTALTGQWKTWMPWVSWESLGNFKDWKDFLVILDNWGCEAIL